MRPAHDEVLNLRLPAALRADLDGAARANGAKVSPIARKALALGLRLLRPDDEPPPPSAPSGAVSMPAVA